MRCDKNTLLLLLVENTRQNYSFIDGLVFAVQNTSFVAQLCKKREASAVNVIIIFELYSVIIVIFEEICLD